MKYFFKMKFFGGLLRKETQSLFSELNAQLATIIVKLRDHSQPYLQTAEVIDLENQRGCTGCTGNTLSDVEIRECGFMEGKLASLEHSGKTEKLFFHSGFSQKIGCFVMHIFNLLKWNSFNNRFRM